MNRYAAEVTPVALRGIFTAFINMAWIIGQLVGQGVCAGTQGMDSKWSYQIPFATQWAWCLLLGGLFFAPESPWYLTHKNRKEDAKASLRRLCVPNEKVDVDRQADILEQTYNLESTLHAESTYWDLFRGTNRRRTEISVVVYLTQVFSGINFSWYCNYFFTLAGLSTTQAFNLGVGNTALGFCATAGIFVLLNYVGRRRAWVCGLSIMTVLMFLIGAIDCAPDYLAHKGYSWAQTTLLIVWTFFYQLTTGPLTYVYIGEISSTRLKARTIALSTASFNFLLIICDVAMPYMFNPEDGNMRGKVGFVFGATSLACLIWGFFRLPGKWQWTCVYIFSANMENRNERPHFY